jgi:hypothetical protein
MSNKASKHKSEEEEIYEKLSSLFIHMEQGLEIRDSNLYENRVTICRGKDLVSFMKDNVEEVAKHIMTICKVDIGPKGKDYMQNFYNVYIDINKQISEIQDTYKDR